MFFGKHFNCPKTTRFAKKLDFSNALEGLPNTGKSCFFSNVDNAGGGLISKYGFEKVFNAQHAVSAFCRADDTFLYASDGKLYCKQADGTETLVAESGFSEDSLFLPFKTSNKTVVAVSGANGLYLFANGILSRILASTVSSMCVACERLFMVTSYGRLYYTCHFSESYFTTHLSGTTSAPSPAVLIQSLNEAGHIDFSDSAQKIVEVGGKVYVACSNAVYCVTPSASGLDFECEIVFQGKINPLTIGKVGGKVCFVSDGVLVALSSQGKVENVLKNAIRIAKNAPFALQTDNYVLVTDVRFDNEFDQTFGGKYAVILHDDFSFDVVSVGAYKLFGGSTLSASDGTNAFVLTENADGNSVWMTRFDFDSPTTLSRMNVNALAPFDTAVWCDGKMFRISQNNRSFPVKLTGKSFYVVLQGNLNVQNVTLIFNACKGGAVC